MNVKLWLINAARLVCLLLAQVFLFRNMGFFNLATPFPYILFVLLLPFATPNWLLYVLGFGSGLMLDVFYDTPGIHATASTLLCLVRIVFINLTIDRNNLEAEVPSLSNMGLGWFSAYAGLGVLFHHLLLFNLEAFRLSELGYTALRALLSGLLTFAIIMVLELVFYRRRAG